MRLWKKLGLIFLCVALVALIVFLWPQKPKVNRYGKMMYEISAGEVMITDCDSSASGTLVIPAEIDGRPVTGIDRSAFRNCAKLQRIIVPDTITSVGDAAFAGCDALEYNFYDNARYLGNEENPYLILISTATKDVTQCIIHGDTRIICDYAFDSCKQLEALDIPDSVTAIGQSAFYFCTRLKTVTIPTTVRKIGDRAFCGCSALGAIDLPEGISTIGYAVFNHCASLTEVNIPSTVTTVGKEAFYSCGGLTILSLPAGITEIGNMAFYGCTALTQVSFGGTQAQWEAIAIGQDNESLLSAQRITQD